MSSTNPHETARRARKVARLVSILTRATPGVSAVTRLGAVARLDAIGWTLACVQIGSRPASETTRLDVLREFARAAIAECAQAATERGDGGPYECLAIGSARAALGLEHDVWRVCQDVHDELVAEAERIRGAA